MTKCTWCGKILWPWQRQDNQYHGPHHTNCLIERWIDYRDKFGFETLSSYYGLVLPTAELFQQWQDAQSQKFLRAWNKERSSEK